MNVEEYLDVLKGQIRDKNAKDFVADEVRGHIEDQAETYESRGMVHEEALSKAVADMGDPVSVGVDLDRIHRPHLEWRFLMYVLLVATLNIGIQYVINRNMPAEKGNDIYDNLFRGSIFNTIAGVVFMLGIYRLDYTILAGKSRVIGGAYLFLLMMFSFVFGQTINGRIGWIGIGTLSIPLFPLMVLFLPLFAGILYEYRGKGKNAIVRVVMWMIVPLFVQWIFGRISLPQALFIMVAEIMLFGIALNKNWYAVNTKKVIVGGMGLIFVTVSGVLARALTTKGYHNLRLKNWLGHFGIGSYASYADSTINYVSNMLDATLAKSRLFGGSEAAIATMRVIPAYRSNLVLGSVSASCGLVSMIGIIACLTVLSAYMFSISLRQKNSLGCIVGCACGVAISLQSLCNILIVLCVLPLTDAHLPFFASGLSFEVVDFILLGLVLSIYRYKDIRKEKKYVVSPEL